MVSLVLQSGADSGTLRDSTCDSLRHVFSFLDGRRDIHFAQTAI